MVNQLRAKELKKQIARHWQLYIIFLLPLLYLGVFKYWPIIGSQIAFRDYTFKGGLWNSDWVGMKHFVTFFKSPQFLILMKNTVGLSLYNIIAGVLPPIVLAIALNYALTKRFGKTIQMVTYMPYFISTVLVVGIMSQILGLNGPVNNFIIKLGASKIQFMGSASLFKSVYVFSDIWQKCGYSAVIYMAALASVDQELHEAAKVDGASIWQRIRHIDIPGILPTVVILMIMASGHVLSMGYEKALLLQNALNMSSSNIIPTYVYQIGLESMNFSYSTAIGLFQSLISLVLLATVNKIANSVSETSLW